MSQRRITEVSSPPEYASTTLFTLITPMLLLRAPSIHERITREAGGSCRRSASDRPPFAHRFRRRNLCLRGDFGRGAEPPSEQFQDDALLGVQAVLRLVEDHAPGPVEDGIRDLLAAVSGEAVHDERARLGEAEERVVELITLEGLQAE